VINKHAQEIIDSIIEEFALCDRSREEMEAKAIFRLLNFCPPAAAAELPATKKNVIN
jgi:hypothetical protein